ncbi:MAG TPA: DUF2118 domain-containing protein [Actinomycetota bacterium]|nr:DUF2118 domain-containing protein [Actinomycetota bacterium]
MAELVRMPKWGLTMEEGVVVEWHVRVGDRVEKGQVLATVESEKVQVELPSPGAGVVAELLVEEGTAIPVGGDVAVLVADEQELASYRSARG